jgi:hypothetical protein
LIDLRCFSTQPTPCPATHFVPLPSAFHLYPPIHQRIFDIQAPIFILARLGRSLISLFTDSFYCNNCSADFSGPMQKNDVG